MSYIHRSVHMPMELLTAFSQHTGLGWAGIEIEGAICDAIAAAMQPQPQPAHREAPQVDSASGYQWKQVFLPEGTVLRASFGRQPYYATVEGAEIKYGEFSLSPSAFANLQGSGNRNAWKAVWLRFPGFKDWVRADECRALRRAATARLFDSNQPNQPAEVEERAAQPAAPVGDYQQRYTDKRPPHHEVIPLFRLLSDFPEDEIMAVNPAPECDETVQTDPAAVKSPQRGKKRSRRHRKASKRHGARQN